MRRRQGKQFIYAKSTSAMHLLNIPSTGIQCSLECLLLKGTFSAIESLTVIIKIIWVFLDTYSSVQFRADVKLSHSVWIRSLMFDDVTEQEQRKPTWNILYWMERDCNFAHHRCCRSYTGCRTNVSVLPLSSWLCSACCQWHPVTFASKLQLTDAAPTSATSRRPLKMVRIYFFDPQFPGIRSRYFGMEALRCLVKLNRHC
jgi:hypothetical protein